MRYPKVWGIREGVGRASTVGVGLLSSSAAESHDSNCGIRDCIPFFSMNSIHLVEVKI